MTYRVKTAFVAFAIALPTHVLADWNGAYAGLSFGSNFTSELSAEVSDFSATYEADPSTTFGVFGGYNVQNADFVFGSEVVLLRTSDLEFENDDQDFNADFNILDLKGRAGYVVDDILFYGVAGFSHIKAGFSSVSEADNDTNGFNFGVGADYDLGNNFVIGAEYLARRATFEDDIDLDLALDTLALKAAVRF